MISSFIKSLLSSGDDDDFEALLKAAEKGDGEMQSNLGMRYLEGEGVEQNYKEAYKWLRKAAEQGYSFNLAQMYATGEGIEKNLREAYAWFSVEAEAGDKSASEQRDKISKQMSPEDIAKAKLLAKEYIRKAQGK